MTPACRTCREPLAPDDHFCTRCGLPMGDACPRCAAEIALASGQCGACSGPLVHCETCGRNYPVDRTRCENDDWNCHGAPLVSAFGAFAGLYGSLTRTSSARGGPAAMQPLDAPLWTFEDAAETILDVLVAYGRAYVFTQQALLSLPLQASGAVDALDPRVGRSSPLTARGREYRRVLDAAVGFGHICVVAEKHDGRADVVVFRADDVGVWWRLEEADEARAAVPVPQAVLVFGGGHVRRYVMGSTQPDAAQALSREPRMDAPPAVHHDGAHVVFGASDGAVVRLHVDSLEATQLLGPGAVGPPVLGPRYVHVLSREAAAAVTLLHQIEVDTGAVDAVSLPLVADLRLRGGGPLRLVLDTEQRAYRAVRTRPWPGRVQAEAMPRPANEDIVTDLVLDGPSLDLLVAAREGGRGELRLLRFDGEAVLRGALDGSARFAACDDRVLLWSEGRLECCALV